MAIFIAITLVLWPCHQILLRKAQKEPPPGNSDQTAPDSRTGRHKPPALPISRTPSTVHSFRSQAYNDPFNEPPPGNSDQTAPDSRTGRHKPPLNPPTTPLASTSSTGGQEPPSMPPTTPLASTSSTAPPLLPLPPSLIESESSLEDPFDDNSSVKSMERALYGEPIVEHKPRLDEIFDHVSSAQRRYPEIS